MSPKRHTPTLVIKVLMFAAILFLAASGIAVRFLASSMWIAIETGRQNTQTRLEISGDGLQSLNEDVINYLNGSVLSDQVKKVFTAEELQHLKDVRNVFGRLYILRDISLSFLALTGLIALVGRRKWWTGYLHTLMWGGFTNLGVILLLGLASVANFNRLFIKFHELLFPPDSWMFSSDSMLIRLYPEGFWIDSLTAALSIIAAIMLINISLTSYMIVFDKRSH